MKNNPTLSKLKTFNLSAIITINLLVMICVAAIAMGCGWEPFDYDSVRFGSHSTEREFYRLPPLPDRAGAHHFVEVAQETQVVHAGALQEGCPVCCRNGNSMLVIQHG